MSCRSASKISCSKSAVNERTPSRKASSVAKPRAAVLSSAGCACADCAAKATSRSTWLVSFRRWRRQHFPESIRLQVANDASLFHGFDHSRSTVVADLQATLNARDRSFARLRHDPDGLIVECILLTVQFSGHTAGRIEPRPVASRALEQIVDIGGLAVRAQRLD